MGNAEIADRLLTLAGADHHHGSSVEQGWIRSVQLDRPVDQLQCLPTPIADSIDS